MITTKNKIGYLRPNGRYTIAEVIEVNILHPTTNLPAIKLKTRIKTGRVCGIQKYVDNIFFDEVENIKKWANEKSIDVNKFLVKII